MPKKSGSHVEGDVGELNTSTGTCSLAAPVLVDIETVGGITSQEVLEKNVLDVSTAVVALEHVNLVTTVGVDVAVVDILDGRSVGEGAHGAAAGLVAPDALNEEVGGGRLDGHAFVAVGHFDVVDPVVVTCRSLMRNSNKKSRTHTHRKCRYRQNRQDSFL